MPREQLLKSVLKCYVLRCIVVSRLGSLPARYFVRRWFNKTDCGKNDNDRSEYRAYINRTLQSMQSINMEMDKADSSVDECCSVT